MHIGRGQTLFQILFGLSDPLVVYKRQKIPCHFIAILRLAARNDWLNKNIEGRPCRCIRCHGNGICLFHQQIMVIFIDQFLVNVRMYVYVQK